MKVTAEGVETQGQLDYLLKKHCDDAQGLIPCQPTVSLS